MATNPRYANGYRRRELRKQLLRQGAHCAWPNCPWPRDRLGNDAAELRDVNDPQFPVVDEIVHVSQGGDPLARDNTRLLHKAQMVQQATKQQA